MKQIRDVLKQLVPPKHLAQDFAQENLLYNNRVFAYFSVIAILLWMGGALAMGVFSSEPFVRNYILMRVVYLVNIGISLFTALTLHYIRKQKPALMWLSTPITVGECVMFAIVLMISGHFEIAEGGIRRIEVLMIVQFAMVFLGRYPIRVIIGLQTAFSAAFVVQLCFEQSLISNFLPCLTNLIATYFICIIASLLYAASRVRNFVDKKNLEALVSIDFLTNVHNRRGFEYVLQISWKEAITAKFGLSLFIIDVDDFKRYNDTYGHQEGDRCLAVVAKVVAESVRKADFVARYGGEEFGVILWDTSRKAAERVAERMLDEMKRQALPHEKASCGFVTFSIGGMFCHPAETDLSLDGFVRKADEALYMAKGRGKNCIVFHPDSL